MIDRFISRSLLLFLGCSLVFPVFADVRTASPTAAEVIASTNSDKSMAPYHVTPGPADGKIAFVTAKLLQQTHFLKQAFDAGVSSKFLDHYLEALDPQHLHFLQSDLAEFERYRTKLGDLTVNQRGGIGDTRPACEIFDRFIQRFQQRVAYVDDLLKHEKFAFDTDDKIMINRKDQPYPKDLNEAKQLWKQRLRFEYLQEKLGKHDAQKKAAKKSGKTEPKPESKPKTESEEIVDTLTHTYHRSLRSFTGWNNEDVLQVYLDTLAHVYDPHSDYMGPSHLDSFSISMNLSLTGIGAELISPDGYCTINRILEGGPAARSKKIKEKDRIVAVAQGGSPAVDVVDMNLNKVVQMIRGPKGTEVRLTIVPAGAPLSATNTITLVRDEIKLEDQAAKAKVIDIPVADGKTNRLGVINLPSFYGSVDLGSSRHNELAIAGGHGGGKSTTADVARLLNKLKAEHVNGVILDLRANGGGFLEEAVNLTGLFIKDGPVVQVRDWKGDLQEENDPDPSVLYDGPLIVLTSRFSASASEILAGALQDYGRALIVGDSSTHGKGTVQSVNELRNFLTPPGMPPTNDYGAVKLTIKKFYRASGASTQLKGVVPDIILPSVASESKDIGEAALENPMPWDTIPGAKYDKVNMVEPYLPDLRKQSTQRIATDKDFAYLREDIDLFKKQQNDKTISLNEKKRLQEKDEAEAREKARDNERRARKPSLEIVHDLSLKQVDLPGLPPPAQKTNSFSTADINSPSVPTNAAAVAAAAGLDDSREDIIDEDKDKVPPADVSLVEAEHIMVDYLSALKQGVLTANHPQKPIE